MSSTIFKGSEVMREDVLRAIKDFDAQYDYTNQYDSWLDKGTYKYALQYKGKLYPCKHILSRATGISVAEFSGGEQTNRVFRDLGFEVVPKMKAVEGSKDDES